MSEMLERYEAFKKERQAAFFGNTYKFAPGTQSEKVIGVMQGLGGTWMVGYFTGSGARKRFKPLPTGDDAATVQQALDAWAVKKCYLPINNR